MKFNFNDEPPKPQNLENCYQIISDLWLFFHKKFKKDRCIFFHSYEKWGEPEQVLIKGEKFIGYQQYRPYEYDGYRQQRFCKRCNKMQKRIID